MDRRASAIYARSESKYKRSNTLPGDAARLPYTSTVMKTLTRITADPLRMGGRPCIRDLRVTVGTVVGLVAAGHARDEILRLYPYLETEDITEALAYAAWRADEFEVPLLSK